MTTASEQRRTAISRRAVCFGLGAAAFIGRPAAADEVILTLINPKISGVHGRIQFTRADLLALEQKTIKTGNDYVDGTPVFRGPVAASVIGMIGNTGAKKVQLTSRNDYSVTLALDELTDYQAILALEMDGKALTRRDRGPIWLMYPMDAHPELQDPAFNSRLIWQVEVIELL